MEMICLYLPYHVI